MGELVGGRVSGLRGGWSSSGVGAKRVRGMRGTEQWCAVRGRTSGECRASRCDGGGAKGHGCERSEKCEDEEGMGAGVRGRGGGE
eukprot:2139825-Rhodomonas_salina.1